MPQKINILKKLCYFCKNFIKGKEQQGKRIRNYSARRRTD